MFISENYTTSWLAGWGKAGLGKCEHTVRWRHEDHT